MLLPQTFVCGGLFFGAGWADVKREVGRPQAGVLGSDHLHTAVFWKGTPKNLRILQINLNFPGYYESIFIMIRGRA